MIKEVKSKKNVEIVFEDLDEIKKNEKEVKKTDYFKNILKALEKNENYHQYFNKDLLLYENKNNGMNTYLSSFSITSHGQLNNRNKHFHIEYSFEHSIGNIEYRTTQTDSLDQKTIKDITVDVLKKIIINIKKFTFCTKCNKNISFVYKHQNGQYSRTTELQDCVCIYGENRATGADIIKDLLDMKITEETCPICQETIDDKYNACYLNKCEKPHYFHLQCLSKAKSGDCPVCRVHSHRILYKSHHCQLNCHDHHDEDDYFSDDEEEYNN
jgi:hypothetical protein